jgi:hypothetical protein
MHNQRVHTYFNGLHSLDKIMLNEKKLVEKLDRILKKEFGTNLAFREFSAGYGIADLVFAPDFSFTRKIVDRAPLTSFGSLQLLLSLESERAYAFEELLNVFPHLSAGEIKKQLRPLLGNDYLRRTADSTYIKTWKEYFNPIKKIIAVEVKLSDHRGGLVQARRYKYFADESYLAILKEAEKNIDLEEFNKHNIGLILFDESTNTVEVRYPQQKNTRYEGPVSIFAREMLLSRYLSYAS